MKLHRDELEYAQLYTQYLHEKNLPFEGLNKQQQKYIVERGRDYYRWFKSHQLLHGIISATVILGLLIGDWLALLWLPSVFLGWDRDAGVAAVILTAVLVGSFRAWLIYSLVVYTIHEGAAHRLIFPPNGRISRWLHAISSNLGRITGADPSVYAPNHRSHHAHFGTEDDGEFLNFVMPRRYWLTLLPFAMFINYSDFIVHRSLNYTRSRIVSAVILYIYHFIFFLLLWKFYGPLYATLVIGVVAPHVGFQLDRLRQFSEHNLMPIERLDGARSFGAGFWGFLIGGGPWGQPCHWVHHLVPAVPWYHQIMLHFDVAKILTPYQRKQYLLEPFVGYPRLIWRLWREPNSFAQTVVRHDPMPAPPEAND